MDTQVRIWSKHRDLELEAYVQERVDVVLGRFAMRMSRVDVQLQDENANKGGVDQVCTIDLKLSPRGSIRVAAKNEDARAAVVKAIHRAERAIAKFVDRGHRSHEIRRRRGGLRYLDQALETIDDAIA